MPEPVIDVENLEKTYPDGTKAVKGITFQVQRGEIFGMLGPNGAGKTSAMRILGTLQTSTGGKASVLGFNVEQQAKEVKKRIGFAMQEVGLDDLATAREMLVLHGKLYGVSAAQAKARAEELLATFDLTEHADRRVTKFSGGMQRRLDLAVTLIHSPEVLFLDEPSTGLDPKSRSTLWAVLRRLRTERGMTIMLSTHYMEEADALCDRIAIMNQGRIAAIDTPAKLKHAVGSDTVRITLADNVTANQWTQLHRVFGAGNVGRDGNDLKIRVRNGAQALMPALKAVTDLGIQVRETKVVTPTLEDAFHKFTGSRFEDAETAAPAGQSVGQSGKKSSGPVNQSRSPGGAA